MFFMAGKNVWRHMPQNNRILSRLWLSAVVMTVPMVYGTGVFAAENAGTILREQQDLEKGRQFEKALQAPQAQPADEVKPAPDTAQAGDKIMITSIQVEGNTLLSAQQIAGLTSAYENKTMNIDEIRGLVAKITGLYREKGYITSRAYLPPQTVESGKLVIKVVEGRMGELTIKGNKYFSSGLLRRKITTPSGGYFDYPDFLKAMKYINEHPDRSVRSNLVPGREPGTTDVVLEVKDRLPVHVGFEADNWASRELGRYRYAVNFQHNNLLGRDDRFYLAALMSEGDHLELQQGRYTYPLGNTWTVGGNFLLTKSELGGAFEALDTHGRGAIYGVFTRKDIIDTQALHLSGNLAFDMKDIKDYSLGEMTSHDELRMARAGFEGDVLDAWGRNIIGIEEAAGIPNLMGGMDAKDPMASRQNSGGQFHKQTLNYYRLQALPWGTSLLLKNNFQYSNNNLPATEQFQIGGPVSVRAYAPAEYSGDSGYYSSAELSIPFYGLSRHVAVPFSTAKLYDAIRFVTFFDMGGVSSRNVTPGEKGDHMLKGYGMGVRFNPGPDTAFRVEAGFPIGDQSADNESTHVWFDLQQQF